MEAAGIGVGERPHQPARLGDVPPPGQRQLGAAEGPVELQVQQRFGAGRLDLDAVQQVRRFRPIAQQHLALGVSQVQRLGLEVDELDLVDRDLLGARPAALIERDRRRVDIDDAARLAAAGSQSYPIVGRGRAGKSEEHRPD